MALSWDRPAPSVIQIEPVYFPTWLVNACALANGIGSEDTRSIAHFDRDFGVTSWFIMTQASPGHHMFPINMLPLTPRSPAIFETLPERWDDSMATLSDYDGRSVTCLPYTRSPLTFVNDFKAASKFVEGATVIAEFAMSVLPLYPVLFPLYLIKFEAVPQHGETRRSQLTVAIQAHQLNGHIFANNLGKGYYHPRTSWTARLWKWWLRYKKEIILTADPELEGMFIRDSPEAVNSAGSSISVYGHSTQVLQNSLWGFINPVYGVDQKDESLWTKLQLKAANSWTRNPPEKINWDDERIRPLTKDEMVTNNAFLMEKTIFSLRQISRLTETIPEKLMDTVLYPRSDAKDANEYVNLWPEWYKKWERRRK
ncbi:hypothetical protein BU17DRAFT_63901 [Hysterangium stoloniferum]|nr:hypothetical protein BU17DRAFT_63901 [Hysterangium stoloniferum]